MNKEAKVTQLPRHSMHSFSGGNNMLASSSHSGRNPLTITNLTDFAQYKDFPPLKKNVLIFEK